MGEGASEADHPGFSLTFALQSHLAGRVRHNPSACNAAFWKTAE